MPIRLELPATLRDRLHEADRPLIGLWACAGSAVTAEIVAGSGCDWALLDAEHSPNGIESVLAQLHAMSAYPATVVVRLPFGDTVLIKQYLDLGVQNLLIPMVDSAAQAAEIVRAVRYPLGGVRGVGSSLARSARWNRVDGYLHRASETISLTVQIESAAAVAEVDAIAATDGVDALFAKYENRPLGEKKRLVGEEVPFGRMGTADDLTGMAIFLASQESNYIVAQTYNVDGGNWMS